MKRRPNLYKDTMQVGIVPNVAEKHRCLSDAMELRAYQQRLKFTNHRNSIKLAVTSTNHLWNCIVINPQVAVMLYCVVSSVWTGRFTSDTDSDIKLSLHRLQTLKQRA